MSIIRLILLLVVLAGLTLLLVQNFSPALPLVFLGMRTQPLPLSLWILFSIIAGGFTSVLIATLLKVGNYFGQQTSTTSFKSTAPRMKTNVREENPPTPRTSRKPTSANDYTTSNEFDDWDIDPNQNNDWDFDEPPQTPSSKTYAPQQPPKNSSASDSVYSYSSQEPKNTGVGKSESVYDADYRVIIPPYQPPTKTTADQTDDDWDFFEDDDFDDDNKPTRR